MLAAAFAALLHLQAPDPLARAWEGMEQCYAPDEVRKTCRALAGYRRSQDGRIINDAEVLLVDADPEMILVSATPVTIRDDLVCGTGKISEGEIQAVIVDGVRITAKNDPTDLIGVIADTLEAFSGGQEICTRYDAAGEGRFTPVVFLDGKQSPDDGDVVIWVRRDDGWRVAP
jgi:hypothetical protein